MSDQVTQTDLDLMQLAAPDPVSMWPETLAWQLLGLLIVLAVVVYIWRRYQHHKKALWKRQALALAETAKSDAKADSWFTLIKRVQLTQSPRQAVSECSDEQLVGLLPGLDDAGRQQLLNTHYQSSGNLSQQTNDAIYHAFIQWVTSLPVEPGMKNDMDNNTGVTGVQHV